MRTDIRTETDKQTKRFANIDNKIGENVPSFSHRQILEVLCICLFVLYDEPGSGRCSDGVCELQRGSLSLLCRYIAVNDLTVIMYYLTVSPTPCIHHVYSFNTGKTCLGWNSFVAKCLRMKCKSEQIWYHCFKNLASPHLVMRLQSYFVLMTKQRKTTKLLVAQRDTLSV